MAIRILDVMSSNIGPTSRAILFFQMFQNLSIESLLISIFDIIWSVLIRTTQILAVRLNEINWTIKPTNLFLLSFEDLNYLRFCAIKFQTHELE